jgi:hypothetical protein
MLIVMFEEEDISKYKKLMDTVALLLKWVYSVKQFQSESFGVGLYQNGYHVDTHSIRLHLALWKSTQLNDMVVNPYYNANISFQVVSHTGIKQRCLSMLCHVFFLISRYLSREVVPSCSMFPFYKYYSCEWFLTTSLMKLSPEDFKIEDSYNGVKKLKTNKNTLHDYVWGLAKSFEIPDCMFQELNNGLGEGLVEEVMLNLLTFQGIVF